MQLKEIIGSCRHLKMVETRCLTEEFIELVFQNDDMPEWQRILSEYLGKPRKPQGQEPSLNDLKLTAGTGSIRIEQTLFEKDFENGTIIGKFWPWRDNRYTTLRMALLIKP
jgi:hypothetical protein